MYNFRLARVVAVVFSMLSVSGCMNGCGAGYSEGERAGQITKFSRKGLFVKSWEGEMALSGMQHGETGAVANIWRFSASDAMAPEVQAAMGKPVRIRYRQWWYAPMWQDSSYDVMDVAEVRP